MSLDPAVAAWLAAQSGVPAPHTLAGLRQATDASLIRQQGGDRDAHYQHRLSLPAADGTPIAVRIYEPYTLAKRQNRPALVYAHGGGWCLGSPGAWESAVGIFLRQRLYWQAVKKKRLMKNHQAFSRLTTRSL